MTCQAGEHPLDHLSGQLLPQANDTLCVHAAPCMHACMHAQHPSCWHTWQVSGGGAKLRQPCAWAGSIIAFPPSHHTALR